MGGVNSARRWSRGSVGVRFFAFGPNFSSRGWNRGSAGVALSFAPYSLGLLATSQQYFSLRTNQPPASSTFLSEQISISHQPNEQASCLTLHVRFF
jgi:hypothetical protein